MDLALRGASGLGRFADRLGDVDQIVEVIGVLREAGQDVLVTRVEPPVAAEVLETLPGGEHDAVARLLWFGGERN